MNNERNNDKLVIVILIILGLVGYIVYEKTYADKNKSPSEEKNLFICFRYNRKLELFNN